MKPKNIFLALEGGSLEQQKKRRTVVFAMLITAAALVLSLVIFLISGVISLISNDTADKDGEDGGTDISTYEPTSFSADQAHNGTLLLVDDNHSYKGNTNMVTLKDSADRPRKPDDSKAVIYSLNTNLPYGGTAEAVSAFNAMIKDFYTAKEDDNLYIENSCHIGSTAQENIFATGLCFELTYYVNWETERDNRPSIYGVEMYQWIYENAHKYGFIQLYSADGENASKANIFRYVGEAHAYYIKKQNISFSEYIALLQTKTPQSPLTVTTASKTKYNIYYIAKDAEQLVPTDSPYTVSGDNLGGYIVTVKMS